MTTKAKDIKASVHNSLASQPANQFKGFDVTEIDRVDPVIIENLINSNDISALGPQQRVEFLKMLCRSLGLNPLSRPLQLVEFTEKGDDDAAVAKKKKLVVYATKDCTEQLRKIHGVSITKLECETVDNIRMVTASAVDFTGRTDSSIGAVALEYKYNKQYYPLLGQHKANAFMKAETKAKRRVTLSICGLGFLDASEVTDLPDANIIDVPTEEGEALPEGAVNKATEGTEPVNGAKELADCFKSIEDAKTRSELSAIHDKYIPLFTSEDLKVKIRESLNQRREQIRREAVSTDADRAATGGLFQS